jgi:uncharacterized protein (TIGR03437 family)
MKRLALILLGILLTAGVVAAQSGFSQVVIEASDPGVFFMVDEVRYYTSATLMWKQGTTHSLRFPSSNDGFQYSDGNERLSRTRYRLTGWEDLSQTQELGDGFLQTVYALPETTRIRLSVTVEHKVLLNFWQTSTPALTPGEAACDETTTSGPGVVIVDGACYWRNTDFWKPAGALQIQAFSFQGWAFTGWGVNGAEPNKFIQSVPFNAPTVIIAYFRTAKEVRFFTEPKGMTLVVDRVPTKTPSADPCPSPERIPPVALPPGLPSRCLGEADWAVGSTHVIGAISPQIDGQGREWVFDGFTNGMGDNSLVAVKDTVRETFVATFVRGARASFHTRPSGLKISVDGRDNWQSYNFIVPPGRTFSVSAPSAQTDKDGRKYVFVGWSNGGEQAQEVTVGPEAVEDGFHLTAIYKILGQTVIESQPSGIPMDVDGEVCVTPCVLDKPDGTEVQITAPESDEFNHAYRRDFQDWMDGAPRVRSITIGGQESETLIARYIKLYLLDTVSVPEDGAVFLLEPSSPDRFYVEGTDVEIKLEPKDGYKFRRWDGDLQGTYPVGRLRMSRNRTAIARLDEVPYAPPAMVQNAAAETPDPVVAAGSLISIYGEKLAPHFHVGPSNPLAQTLLGVTVRGGDYVLALPFVSTNQINAVLHPDIPEGQHQLIVSRAGELDVEAEFTVARNAPGIFSRVYDGQIFAMASHEDGTPISPQSPARKGELISVYATGLGAYDKIAPYGFALPSAPEFQLLDTIDVWAGGTPLKPEFAGGAAGYTGTDVVKLLITDALPAGTTVELLFRINGRTSNTVLLPLE